jgi:hypothetical protein
MTHISTETNSESTVIIASSPVIPPQGSDQLLSDIGACGLYSIQEIGFVS